MAKLLRDGGYSYDQSKHLIAEARRRVGLTPPQRKKGSVERLTREELKALRRAACLLSLRPLSIGRFERSSECEARSIRKTTARSSSSLISAQSAGTTLCSTGSTSPDQSWSRRETPELYRMRLHVSACYPYDAETNTYCCPAGQRLAPGYRETAGKTRSETILVNYLNRAACRSCAVRDRCTKNTYRRIVRYENEATMDRMADRLAARPEVMDRRRESVEHPFGSINQWMGHGAFLTQRLGNVRAEFSLTALAYNMRRAINLAGIPAMISAATA